MQFLVNVLRQDGVDNALISLLQTVGVACKEINFRLHQGALAGVLGSTEDENVQGEVQKKLDVISNDLLKDLLLQSGLVKALASEEEDDIVVGDIDGQFLIAFDPLDGSSNIDINAMVGTIFSIYRANDSLVVDESSFLQPGSLQVAAGYVVYGPATLLVLTTGNGVKMFTLDQTLGEYLLTVKKVNIDPDTQEFAINMSNQRHWAKPMQDYIDDLLKGSEGPRGKNFNMRWVAAMVADVHRILCRGGLFSYPWDRRAPEKPGKLRLMYEANPMAMLIEQAGGRASTGTQRILDIQPEQIHQRVAVVLGAANEVGAVEQYYSHQR
ncbi:class 1 fructose-bisphosphatase [Gallaecimonas pentaromativorans]|uniref:Fructose-1,6-bisphosphatase class 1 n=1 Tax=Gallaecimonas pentaromativorans TaxID=584787 RepID=A0A3N1PPQ8_9GAMM|nr:class 1 fructose-bisphosphatase [Gallaecimonas pentaromativorans]ROQ30493.1 D-fructose 1,6-bisphosphatase [Gallaecimonas pentaromativorans]